ncbi:MAG: hypothetical protein PVG07_06775 [Acidobacteriota bacterium]|jgi:hypothetical protein
MRPRFDPREGSLALELDDLEAVESFLDGARSQDGFLLALPEEPHRGTELAVTLTAPGGFELAFRATVLHVFGRVPGAGGGGEYTAAFQMADWGQAKRMELRRKLGQARSGAGDGEGGEAAESAGETLGASPMFRIQKMTPPQKARLALKANRTERQILLRETSPQVMMGLLNNPHVDSDDVLQMIKSPYVPGGILKRVAGDRRWVQNREVRLALVRNPRTPPPLAIRLLPGLPTPSLKALAGSSEVREDLKKAALKLYIKRTGR